MSSPIAKLELIEVTAKGERLPLSVSIDAPRPGERAPWSCAVSVDGFERSTRDIHGEDAMQALLLGLRLVRTYLVMAIERGSRLVSPDSDIDFPFHAYFERLADEDSIS